MDKTLIEQFEDSMGIGYGKKGTAHTVIGVSPKTRQRLISGERNADKTERLAMSAVAAGLPEWSPEHAKGLKSVRTIVEASKDIKFKVGPVKPTDA